MFIIKAKDISCDLKKPKKNTVDNNQLFVAVAVHATAALKQLQTDKINAIILMSCVSTGF